MLEEYNGEERRKDYSQIAVLNERTKNMESVIDEIKIEVNNLVKLLPALPCAEQKRRIDFLQTIILSVIIIGILLGLWVKTIMAK